ncbi:MAG: glycosyltransferase [Phycisphaerales bacterium]|nr:glycosyltransferase [Planctomycetota bacterium]
MSSVLVISAHSGLLDRRIVAQLNELAASGRKVRFVTTPVQLDGSGLHPAVDVIGRGADSPSSESGGGAAKTGSPIAADRIGPLKRLYRMLPQPVRLLRRDAGYTLFPNRQPPHTRFLVEAAAGLDADAVHCHDLETLPAADALCAAIAVRTGVRPKLIYDTHELFPFQEPSRSFQRYWTAIERRFIAGADAIIAVNSSIADELVRRYRVPAPAVLYNSFGVSLPDQNLTRAEALHRLGFAEEGPPVVLFQGGFTWARNLRNLVLAFASLEQRARLALLGGGPAAPGLQSMIRNQGMRNVSIASWVRPDELLSIVRRVDMGIIPYRGDRCLNDRFCTPNKLFEFMEVGLPICSSDLPELRRIVRGCGIGEVYDMSDASSIAAAVTDCLEKVRSGAFTGLRDTARTEHLRWPAQARTLLGLYDRLGV